MRVSQPLQLDRGATVDPQPQIAVNTFNEWNQLLRKDVFDELGNIVDVFHYEYDRLGNLIEISSFNEQQWFTYDSRNRLSMGWSSLRGESYYEYNALGFIVSRAQSTPEGFSVTNYVLDYTSPYQSVLAKYSWVGWDLEMVERNVLGLDRISTNGLFIQNDRLGSGRIASDAAGNVVVTAQLDEWGALLYRNDPHGVLNNFTNHEFDEVLGLYFAKARFYCPVDRRFTQVDPARDGVNWYAYVANNPLKYIDPTGLFTVRVMDGRNMVSLSEYLEGRMPSRVFYELTWDDETRTATVEMWNSPDNLIGDPTRYVNRNNSFFSRFTPCEDGAFIEDDRLWIDNRVFMRDFRFFFNHGVHVTTNEEAALAGLALGVAFKTGQYCVKRLQALFRYMGFSNQPPPSPTNNLIPMDLSFFGKKSDIQQVNAAARSAGVDRILFGEYVHEVKAELGMRANQNFTYAELLELARQLKEMLTR